MGFVVGIGGISRSGKSSVTSQLEEELSCVCIRIDSYLKGPIQKQKPNGEFWDDWEDPVMCDMHIFYENLLELKDTHPLVIAEGYLLYHDPKVIECLDLKFHIDIPKEVAKERRRRTKNLTPDFEEYFEHIWSAYYAYNDLSDASIHVIDGTEPLNQVTSSILNIINSYNN